MPLKEKKYKPAGEIVDIIDRISFEQAPNQRLVRMAAGSVFYVIICLHPTATSTEPCRQEVFMLYWESLI